MHKLLFFGLVAALMWGCKKGSTEEPAPASPQEILPKVCRLTSEAIDGKPYRTYQYIGDSVLFRIAQYERLPTNREEKRYTFKYDAKNRVSVLQEVQLIAPFVNYEYQFHYDIADRVDTVRQFQLFNAGPKLFET